MGFQKFRFEENSETVSSFARALVLPVRVSILRILLIEDSWVNNEVFTNLLLKPVTRDRHLMALEELGLIKQSYRSGIIYYKINEINFKKMVDDFTLLFNLFKESSAKKGNI